MKALVTGANGFVGRAMLSAASRAGIEAVGISRRDHDYSPDSIARLVDATGVDLVFHAAGEASVAASMADPVGDFDASVALLKVVLAGLRASSRRPRIIYPSSAAIYGNPEAQPISESSAIAPISAYGYHKAMCELLVREYAHCFGVPGLIVRPFSLFGESQRRLLVWEIFRQCREASMIDLSGSGEEERDYLHVDDFADLAWALAVRVTVPCQAVNVASGFSIRVLDLAKRVGDALGGAKRVTCRGLRSPGDPVVWRADISLLQALCGDIRVPSFPVRLEQVLRAWSQ